MATSFNVNLTITSAVGFRRSSTQTFINFFGTPTVGGISGPRPLMTTTYTLNGVSQPDISITGTRILSVSTTTDFYFYPGGTSPSQTISITNLGSNALSLLPPFYLLSNNGTTAIIDDVQPPSGVIASGNTGTITVSYTGNEEGEFYNYIILITDADSPQYKIITKQVVTEQLLFDVEPSSYTRSSTSSNYRTTATYTITPIINGVENPGYILPITSVLSNTGTGWSIISNQNNQVQVTFNSNVVNNTTGTYTATLTLSYGDNSVDLTNTVNLNVDYSDDSNITSWLSAPSAYDSIIGISYDIINGRRHLTIGVGSNADGSPIFAYGGSENIKIANLSYKAADSDTPFLYWAQVARIPLDGTARTYYSKDYIVKNTGTNYAYYFGENLAPQSMFIVEDDGYYNVTIKMNHLRELSENSIIDATLRNLTRAFYDYSGIDVGDGRYYQNGPILPDGITTLKFNGFYNDGTTVKYPVLLPTI
jgi:hypothetical protein